MSRVYNTQSLLTLSGDTEYAGIAGATVKRLLFTKPDGTKGYFTATVSGTKLTYDVANGDIDQVGTWKFQTYIEIAGLKGPGEIYEIDFYEPLL